MNLDQVPASWQILPLKRIVSMKSGEAITSEKIEESGPFPVFGANGRRGYTATWTHEGVKVLIGRQGALCGNVNVARGRFFASEHALVVEPTGPVDLSWLAYLLEALDLGQYSTSAAQPGVGVDVLSRVVAPVPPQDDQSRIGDYLDRETARIDELIAEQEALVGSLGERRMAVISEAVFGASEQPISRNFSVVLGKMLDGARTARADDKELPYLRAANIQDEGVVLDSVNRMSFTAQERSSLDLRAGDLLVVEGGAVGTCVVLDEDMPGWSFQKTLNRVRPRYPDASTRFLAYVLRSYRDSGYIDIVCNKSTIPHLTAEKLLAMRVPQPPADEQLRVVRYLDAQAGRIDELAANCRELISLLRERRSALITAAVTGKLNVRAT